MSEMPDASFQEVQSRIRVLRTVVVILVVAVVLTFFAWKRDEGRLEALADDVQALCGVAEVAFRKGGTVTLALVDLIDEEHPGAGQYLIAGEHIAGECRLDEDLRRAVDDS